MTCCPHGRGHIGSGDWPLPLEPEPDMAGPPIPLEPEPDMPRGRFIKPLYSERRFFTKSVLISSLRFTIMIRRERYVSENRIPGYRRTYV